MAEEAYTREELEGFTVAELREILEEAGLDSKGKKADLVSRALGEAEPGADLKPITRRTATTWWCPFCDHSTFTSRGSRPGYPDSHVCAGCGALADDDYEFAEVAE